MKKVYKYITRYKLRMGFGLIIKVVGTVMDLAIPYVLSFIIDDLIPLKDIKQITLFGGLMIVFSVIGVLFNVIANRMASKVARNVTCDLRHDLFAKTQSLSSTQVDSVTMPSLISRMSTDTYNIHQMVGMMQRIGVRAPILLLGGIIVTLSLDPVLTLVLLAILPLIVFFTILLSKLGIPIFTKVQNSVDSTVRIIRENITGIRVIKALSKEDYEREHFQKVNEELINYELKSGYIMGSLKPIISVLLNIGLVGVIIVGAIRVNNGLTGIGKVISFTSYFTIILNAMLTITRIFVVYSRSVASGLRINYVLNLPVEINKEEETMLVNPENHIEFDNVNFSYNKKEYNLKNISFSLKQGESLGIIGATGAGKSTIIQLLMRFYDCDSGVVRINGRNIKEINDCNLKTMFGTVFQNDTIFSNSIKENIVFGRDISNESLEKALKVSQVEEFISEQKNGIDSILAPKGSNISGGQKQRILIARALVGDPSILILDDASSALDYKTDALLRQGIKEFFSNTTTIIIAQRISSIINCDNIMVLEDGEILGYGKHNELLKNVGVYQEIYASQMGGIVNE